MKEIVSKELGLAICASEYELLIWDQTSEDQQKRKNQTEFNQKKHGLYEAFIHNMKMEKHTLKLMIYSLSLIRAKRWKL